MSADAKWLKIWTSDVSEHLIQTDTVKYKGKEKVTFWLLSNNNSTDELGHLSYKQKIEIDCTVNQSRVLNQIGYPMTMGSGASTRYRKAYEEWDHIASESLGGELYRHLCTRKSKVS